MWLVITVMITTITRVVKRALSSYRAHFSTLAHLWCCRVFRVACSSHSPLCNMQQRSRLTEIKIRFRCSARWCFCCCANVHISEMRMKSLGEIKMDLVLYYSFALRMSAPDARRARIVHVGVLKIKCISLAEMPPSWHFKWEWMAFCFPYNFTFH